MEDKIGVCLVGAMGKMGEAIINVISEDEDVELVAAVDLDIVEKDNSFVKKIFDLSREDISVVDVVINFTNPEATLESAEWCRKQWVKIPLVTGTTGLDDWQSRKLKEISEYTPILWAPNMSLGVNLIDSILPQLVRGLPGFSLEIVELHHDKKRDSPSGTAERFATTLVESMGGSIVYGRIKGHTNERSLTDVVVHSIRGGTVAGEHTIYFLGEDEIIEITHRSLSNKIFALGTIKAVKWIIGKESGFYTMKDVLSL